MSIPRWLTLKQLAFIQEEPATYVLNQRPVDELVKLRANALTVDATNAMWPPMASPEAMIWTT